MQELSIRLPGCEPLNVSRKGDLGDDDESLEAYEMGMHMPHDPLGSTSDYFTPPYLTSNSRKEARSSGNTISRHQGGVPFWQRYW